MNLKDGELKMLPKLMELVQNENKEQLRRWGAATHDSFKWMTILGEEVGEMHKAILEHSCDNGMRARVVRESIQTATLALKIAEMYLVEMQKDETNRQMSNSKT